MNSSESDKVLKFSTELSRLVRHIEYRMHKRRLDSHGLAILHSLPAAEHPANAGQFDKLVRFQSYGLARSQLLSDEQKALAYRFWSRLSRG